ncbi:hypothetical protein V8G54_009272 [Vigna mungo]|uniref:Methyltransferase n=1 Tax=Vigna mungo TaxID=3915 RepID=A0AAQ3NU56_VIGMU
MSRNAQTDLKRSPASGCQTLILSSADSRYRHPLVEAIETNACPVDTANYTLCEDPRLNNQQNTEMNYYRERHCPRLKEWPLCLIPSPNGYRVSVLWPKNLHKRKCFPFLPLGILSLNVKDWFSLRIGFFLTFIVFVVSIAVQCSEMASSGLEHRWTKLSVRHPTRPSDQPSTSTNEHPTEQPPISSDGPPTSSNVPPNDQPSTSLNQPQ